MDSCIRGWILGFVGGFLDSWVDSGKFLDSYTDSRFRCGFLDSWWIPVDSKRACTRFGACRTPRCMVRLTLRYIYRDSDEVSF